MAALALAAAVWAVAASALFLPRLTDNGDEAVYLLQAESIRAGHLFPPAAQPAGAFLPWLSKPAGDHYVTKYTPVFPGIHRREPPGVRLRPGGVGSDRGRRRGGLLLPGPGSPGPAAGRRRGRRLPGRLTALRHPERHLSQLSVQRRPAHGLRRRIPGRSPAGEPVAPWPWRVCFSVWRSSPDRSTPRSSPGPCWSGGDGRGGTCIARRLNEAGWVALGAAAPLHGHGRLLPGRDRAASSGRRSPSSARATRSDSVPSACTPACPSSTSLPGRALVAFGRLTVLTGFWGFGGLLLIGLAVVGYRSFRGRAGRWLAVVAVTVPVGYGFFWGSFSSSEWGGPWRFGPFYWLPVLVPAEHPRGGRLRPPVALGPRGGPLRGRRDGGGEPVRGRPGSGRAQALRGRPGPALRRAAGRRRRVSTDAVVFLPPLDGPYLLQPFSLARNATFDGPVVWALDRGARRNLDVVQRLPGRTPYRVLLGGGRPVPHPPAAPDASSTAGWCPSRR